MSGSSLVVLLGNALNVIASTFEWLDWYVQLVGITGGGMTRKSQRSLHCLLVEVPIIHTRYSLWRRNLSHNSLSGQIPSVSSQELTLPRLIRCELSRLRCTVTAFFCPLTYAG